MKNLETKEGCLEALENLNKECKQSFIDSFIEISDKAIFRLDRGSLEISILCEDIADGYYGRPAFASEIQIYAQRTFKNSIFDKENEINFGSSGSFSPENKASYWRTVHAASCLKNWDKVCQLVNFYCQQYQNLEKEIEESITK